MGFDVQDILDRARGSSRVGDHEEAERLLKQYLAKTPDDRAAHLLLGTTLAREEKLNEAADEFTTLLAKNPRDVEALNNLAVIYRRQEKFQDALVILLDAIDIEPTRAEFHYNIGNIHKQLGNLKAASMAYAKVVELNPDYVHAYNNLGTIYDQLKEYDKAYNMFRKGLALDRNNPTLHFNYGVALEANGRFEDALNEYRAAMRSKPGWLQPVNNMGIIYFKQGQHTKALETFNRILHTDPLNAEARNNMGVVQADQGKTKEAVENYRRAIEADPKYVKAVVNLERTLEDAGDFADAVVELEKLIKLVPNSADVRGRLASLYLKMERYPEALQQAKTALEWEPENIQALRIEGSTLRIMGDDAEAQKIFEKILALDPGNYAFQLDLADIHFKRKEYKEAEERIVAFLTRRPNDREAKMLLGRLYAAMGSRTHAIQIFEELARADPNDTDALAAAAELHKDAGEVEKALRTADKLVNLQGKRATPDDLSDLNESLAFYESAVKAYSPDVLGMWEKNLKILQEAAEEDAGEEADIALLMGAVEKTPLMDEETEALFIEDPEAEPEEEELFLDEELPLFDEEPLPDMSLDNLAENPPMETPPPAANVPQEASPEIPPQPPQNPKQPYPPEDNVPEPQMPQPQYQPPPPQPRPEPPPQYPPPPPQPQPQPEPRYQPPPPAYQPPRQPQYPQPPQYPPPPQKPQYRDDPPAESAAELPIEPPIDEEEETLSLEDGGEELPQEWTDDTEPVEEEQEPEEPAVEAAEEEFPAGEAETPELFDEEEHEDIFAEPPPPEAEPEEFLPEESPPEPYQDMFDEPDTSGPSGPAPLQPEQTAPPEAPLDLTDKKEGITKDSVLGLMNYLKDLAGSLPDKKRDSFMKSDARLSMEYVINTLEGKKGLLKEIKEKVPFKTLPPAPPIPGGLSPTAREKIAGTLSYLRNLAGSVETRSADDQNLFTALRQKVQSIMARIKAVTDKRQNNG